MTSTYDQTTQTARDYYNSADADTFYAEVWGGEDIHIGIYESPDEDIRAASRRTVDHIADKLSDIDSDSIVLDIGSGYGGAARRLVERFGCRVTCLNLAEAENERNRELNEAKGLTDHITVVDGSFESIPLDDESVHVVWSQDAILHAGDREAVLREVDRVLKPGGVFVFTDPMRSDDCPTDMLQPILDRIHLSDLGSPGFYRKIGTSLGWEDLGFEDMTNQLINHYTRVLETTVEFNERLKSQVSYDYIERMKVGLTHWIEGGRAKHLVWGVFKFKKS